MMVIMTLFLTAEERGLICERFSEMQWSEAEHERSEYGTYNLSALGLLSLLKFYINLV
jgi:hypothetical protein